MRLKKLLLISILTSVIAAPFFAQQKERAVLIPMKTNGVDKNVAISMDGRLFTELSQKNSAITLINYTDIDILSDIQELQQKSITEKVTEVLKVKNVKYLIIGNLTGASGYNTYNLDVGIYTLDMETVAAASVTGMLTGDYNECAKKIADQLFAPPKPKGNLSIKQSPKEKSVTVEWNRADDKEYFKKSLQYEVVYSDCKDDLVDNLDFADEDGTVGMNWSNTRRATFDVPDANETYYFTVIVKNTFGIKAMYEVKSSTGKVIKEATTSTSSSNASSAQSIRPDFKLVEGGTLSRKAETEKSQTSTPQSSSATSKSSDSTISKQSKDETKTTNSDTAKKYDDWDIGPGGGRVFHAFDSTGLKTYEYVIFNDKKTQNEAIKACSNYRGGGFSNWRLVKNSDEIYKILSICPRTDANPYGEYIKDENFKKGACYWSADPGVACKIKEPSLIEQIYGSYGKWEYSKENVNPQKKYGYIAVREIL